VNLTTLHRLDTLHTTLDGQGMSQRVTSVVLSWQNVMLGYLIPADTGKPIPLAKPRLLFGPRVNSTSEEGPRTRRDCELRFVDGHWYIQDRGSPTGILVNDERCKSRRLSPGDVLTIGTRRFTLVLTLPEPAEEATTSPPAAETAPGPAKSGSVLGMLIPCGEGKGIPLVKERMTVGRDKNCDIVLKSPTVSSLHCGLEFVDGFWRIVDLGSRNGIRVGGFKCKRRWVRPKDILSIGKEKFQLRYTPAGDEPPEEEMEDVSSSLMDKAGIGDRSLERVLRQVEAEGGDDEPKRRKWEL